MCHDRPLTDAEGWPLNNPHWIFDPIYRQLMYDWLCDHRWGSGLRLDPGWITLYLHSTYCDAVLLYYCGGGGNLKSITNEEIM